MPSESSHKICKNSQTKQLLTVWAVFVRPGRCWPTNNDRENERPLGNQNNPLLIMLGIQAKEENIECARRNDLK